MLHKTYFNLSRFQFRTCVSTCYSTTYRWMFKIIVIQYITIGATVITKSSGYIIVAETQKPESGVTLLLT